MSAGTNFALFAGPAAAPQLVAHEGDQAGGAPAGVTYSDPATPAVNDAGQLAFRSILAGGDVTVSTRIAIFAGPATALQMVARDGGAAPGGSAGMQYASLNFAEPALNEAGDVAFIATLQGTGVSSGNNQAIFAGPAAAPQLVARRGGAAPGTPGMLYGPLGPPVINGAGAVAFESFLTVNGIPDADNQAVFAGPAAAPQLVARSRTQAPGAPAGVNYHQLDVPALTDAGQVVYRSSLAGTGVTSANDSAVFAGPPAAPQLVAREGDVAPGTAAGTVYGEMFAAPALNGVGRVAFTAALAGPAVTSANDRAIFAGPPAAPDLVVREGAQAAGLPAGLVYAELSSPTLNDAGQIAYSSLVSGSGVGGGSDGALFAYDPRLGTMLIAREGSPFDVGGGTFRTVADFGIAFESGAGDDTRTGLGDDGRLAFALTFTDGTSGAFVYTIPIPEPAGLGLLAAGGLLLLRREGGRRSRRAPRPG